MKIRKFIVGRLLTNCYVVSCSKTAETIVVDPGFETTSEFGQLTNYVNKNSLKIKFIVNTHGHADHISGNLILKKEYSVPFCIHQYDAVFLNILGDDFSPSNILFQDGSSLNFGQISLKVMHTPGHSLGSISLVGKGLVFTGDTLFSGGIGRTDFPGGSIKDIKTSLQKLMNLPKDYVIYPGHGCESTLGKEKRSNPFLLSL